MGDITLAGLLEDKEESGAELESLDFREDESAFEVGIEPPLSVGVWERDAVEGGSAEGLGRLGTCFDRARTSLVRGSGPGES